LLGCSWPFSVPAGRTFLAIGFALCHNRALSSPG
jgi:hypothetical protein